MLAVIQLLYSSGTLSRRLRVQQGLLALSKTVYGRAAHSAPHCSVYSLTDSMIIFTVKFHMMAYSSMLAAGYLL